MNPRILAGVLIITALHAFDELVLVIALPTIAEDLGSGYWYGLVIAGYILASIVGMAWAGVAMDQRGPGRVLKVAASLFAVGLVLAIVAQNTLMFLGARLLQGVGGGIGWTLAFALINLTCPAEKKPKAIAAMDIAWVVPSLLAPIVGGILVDYINWRWIFVIQIPPLLLALTFILPQISALTGSGARPAQLPILLRACRIAAGCGLLIYALGQPVSWVWIMIVPALVLAIPAINQSMPERWWRVPDPLSMSLMIAIFAFLVFYGMEAYQPLYLIDARGMSTLQAGLVLTCASVCWMLGSVFVARFLQHLSYHIIFSCGMGLILLGIMMLGVLFIPNQPVAWAYVAWSVAGIGMGMTFNASRTTAMRHTPQNREGFVASAVSLSASIGLGLAAGLGGGIKNQAAYMEQSLEGGIWGIWLFSIAVALVALFLLGIHISRRKLG